MLWPLLLPVLAFGQTPAGAPNGGIFHGPVTYGWHDELNSPGEWKPQGKDNPATTSVPVPGALRLSLGHVPKGWPYAYHWSGVTRQATVNIGRYPYLTAHVSELLGGYAHMDIDVVDAQDKPVKTFRSSTLQSGGVTFINLRGLLDPAVYTLKLRLIVGGSNQGCWCTYNWVRFTSIEDGEFLRENPNWGWIQSPVRR